MEDVPQLVVLKDGIVIDNVLLHGKDTFMLGRHQNCDIVAGHASISRHHLEIRIVPQSRELLLMDMHSVHGTRLNGEPLLPLDSVAMKEDGKFEVGASTRTYMVKWIPVPLDQSDSSSSSCTSSASIAKELEEEFQSVLKLESSHSHKLNNAAFETKKQPEAEKRPVFAELNGRAASPPVKKPALPRSPARRKELSPSLLRKTQSLRTSPAGKRILGEQKSEASPSRLWLRRGYSMELPTLVTATASAAPSAPPSTNAPSAPPFDENKFASEEGGYFSDKENVAPVAAAKPVQSVALREPLKPLPVPPSPSVYSAYSDDENSCCTRRSRVTERFDEVKKKKQWHIIVDTNCFLDDKSFDSLTKLEGLRETRIIIPKIVVRELDFLKRKEDKKYQCRRSLRWIEDCMLDMPWWIHVQKTNETRPVGATPPVSPSPSLAMNLLPYGTDLLSPTNDDHVLDCALLFERSVVDGRVVLLTNDTALKIKAMAEGLVAEKSTTFCESLLSPYSKRFLWAGSTVCRSPVISPLARSNCGTSCSGKNAGSSGKLETVDEQPKGLQVVL